MDKPKKCSASNKNSPSLTPKEVDEYIEHFHELMVNAPEGRWMKISEIQDIETPEVSPSIPINREGIRTVYITTKHS